MALPAWLRATVVVILVLLGAASLFVPPVLRSINDTLFDRKVRREITTPEGLIEVVRIRNQPRRWFGRGAAPDDRSRTSPPPPRSTGGNEPPKNDSSDDPSGDGEDDPP